MDSVQSDVILQFTVQDTLLLRLLGCAWRGGLAVGDTLDFAENLMQGASQRWPICDKIYTVSLKLMRRSAGTSYFDRFASFHGV